jgi:hypothetical protein
LEETFGNKVNNLSSHGTPGTLCCKIVRPSDLIDRIDSKWQARYRSGVGMMLFLIKNSRPDSINVVLELHKCMDGASIADYKVMLRGMKFDLDTNPYCLRSIQWMKEKNGI